MKKINLTLTLFIMLFSLSGCFDAFSASNMKIAEPTVPTEPTNPEVNMIIQLNKIPEKNFYWVPNDPNPNYGSIRGYKDGLIDFVTITAIKTKDGEQTTLTVIPKIFFILDETIYLASDFYEYIFDENGEQSVITIEKMFKQDKGENPVEIDSLPSQPEINRITNNDGKYKIFTTDYQGEPYSDITRIVDNAYCGRNIMISAYFYGYFESCQTNGAFIDIQEGLPGVREKGLYFVSDRFTSQDRIFESGRMWNY